MLFQTTYKLRPGNCDAEVLGILLHLLISHMHRRDVHVSNVDGHLGDVPLCQPPADTLHCLQSAGLVISSSLLADVESNSESN